MKLLVSISGEFTDSLDDGDLLDLECDLEDTLRIEYGGKAVFVEVNRA